ncbi:hypothetical protein [Sulfitobacter pontiacus]|nr:hypothetical protein [Sulfitobacter pontiacus]HAR83750.1 hypothetical protein [Sulfitobacter pontiacus]
MNEKREDRIARDSSGRFRGAGAYRTDAIAPTTKFTAILEAGKKLRSMLIDAHRVLKASTASESGVPTVIVSASPGAGKSTSQRELQSERVKSDNDDMVAFHVPTLSLAEDAAREATVIGIDAQSIRGRSASRPDGDGMMCAKAKLVSKASHLGISVRDNFCERHDDDGTVRRCAHFENCAYIGQFNSGATHRFMSTTYIGLPDPSGTKYSQRVVDETFWRQLLKVRDIEASTFTSPRTFMSARNVAKHADLLAAAQDVFSALITGRSPLSLPYSAEDYKAFERLEWDAQSLSSDLAPDQDSNWQLKALAKAEANFRQVSGFGAIWSVLSSAKDRCCTKCERLRMFVADGKYIIRVMTKSKLQHSEPMLVLDADADPEIITALGCDVLQHHDLVLAPNATIRQLHDRRMCTSTIRNSKQIRQSWRQIIAKEVLIDRLGQASGVLVGASRKVVKAFFEDAGYQFDGLSSEAASELMLETKLHGAQWLWFGGRALGSNRYESCSSVVVIGREEIPTQTLEDLGVALWGDTGDEELQVIEPDELNNKYMPATEVPYLMADGSSMAVAVPCHPDRRVRKIQLQTREYATRQLIERLRLARSNYSKRVLIGCNIPIPNVPVSKLMSWEELCVDRVEAAVTVGLIENGSVRLTQQGLHDAAPTVFRSLDAVKSYLKRNQTASERLAYYKTLSTGAEKIKTITVQEYQSMQGNGQGKEP